MRNARSDPFTPGFGNLPVVFAGRDHEFDDLATMVDRLSHGIYEQPRMVTGDRGMGKTSLLLHFEAEQREQGCWIVRAPATREEGAVIARLCRGLAELLRDNDLIGALADAGRKALERLAGISLDPRKGLSFDLSNSAGPRGGGDELRALLEAVGRLARDRKTVLLLAVDEAQNIDLDTLGQVFYALQEVQGVTVDERDPETGALRRDALPLGVVVAGLPGLVGRLKKAGSTFGERSKSHRLDVLDRSSLLIQRRYLHVAARIEPERRSPGAVASELGRTSNQLGSTLNALTDTHGLLRNDGTGRLVFALPGLDAHLREAD